MPKVYNMRDSAAGLRPEGLPDVLVDRRTLWGNPFKMKGTSQRERDRVCDEFEAYATERHAADPSWLAPLRGANLVCWCAPKRCHADTLLRLANEEIPNG
jgi:hypothetical protein